MVPFATRWHPWTQTTVLIKDFSVIISYVSFLFKWYGSLPLFTVTHGWCVFAVGHIRKQDGFFGMYRGLGARLAGGMLGTYVTGAVSTVNNIVNNDLSLFPKIILSITFILYLFNTLHFIFNQLHLE